VSKSIVSRGSRGKEQSCGPCKRVENPSAEGRMSSRGCHGGIQCNRSRKVSGSRWWNSIDTWEQELQGQELEEWVPKQQQQG